MVKGRYAGSAEQDRGSNPSGARRERKDRSPRRRAVALVGLFLALALAAAVLYRPMARYLESRNELARSEAQLAEERALTRELEERRDRASSDEYVEGEARRMGYVKPGEVPLIILDDMEDTETVEGEDPTRP
ncbi:MAG: septum formation initiator family protein [Actinomycetota bacterium]|nr:septum formation initiator family protein [Actinomycetota bacterium]MDI7252278.1 septum formation initiator family protein [Actinomycetota bacterium]